MSTPELVRTEPDRAEAEKFITALCGTADAPVTFQTYDDAKQDRPLARVLYGTLAEHWDALCRLNAQGAGVFLMVNEGDGQVHEGETTCRTSKNVTAVRALFGDDDSGKLKVNKLKLKPTVVVQSRAGIQPHWKLRPGEPLDKFKPAQKALAKKLRTDPAVNDLPRVMRLPGFLHLKDPAAPFFVRVVAMSDATYSIEEVLSGLGAKTATPPPATEPVSQAGATNDADPAVLKRAVDKLATIPGGVQGNHGSNPTFVAAMALVRGFNLSDGTALALLKEHYNPRCSPTWGDKELEHKIKSARETGRMAFGYLLTPHGHHDNANGQRLAVRHGQDLRYCHPLKTWLVWDGKRWTEDKTGQVVRLAKDTAVAIGAEAEAWPEQSGTIFGWAKQSQMAARLASMVDLARSELPVQPYELDRDLWLFNVENGTIDLRTNELREHRREDLLTKIAPDAYDPAAKCPLWIDFLAKVQPQKEVRDFLQRLFGYALTGDVAEEIFTIIQGDGQRGKSTLLNTLQAVLGEYAVTVQPGIVLSADRHADPERATPELMKLRGARLAVAYETADGVTLDDAKIKRVASTDTIAARGLHKDSIEFLPTHKTVLVTNHKPKMNATDYGTWRRVCLILFEVTLTEAEKDIHFKERLREEYPGILAWMVEGCRLWQREKKLIIPDAIRIATDEYKKSEDVLGQFVADRLNLSPEASAPKGEVYGEYQRWAGENGIQRPLTKPSFAKRIANLTGVKDARTETARLWTGLGLKTPPVKGQWTPEAEAARMAQMEGLESQAERPRTRRKGTRGKP